MDELSELNLLDDLREIAGTEDSRRWAIEHPAAGEVWSIMSPVAVPSESFQARWLWSVYPGAAPSLKFRDPASGRLDLPRAWPLLPGFRPQSLDACVNWTAEGLALHQEWTRDPNYRWDPRGNVQLKCFRILQDLLDTAYQGRAT